MPVRAPFCLAATLATTLAATLAVAAASPAPVRAAGKSVDGVVNLNTAAPDVLALLPGIGPAKVQSIVAYRKRRPFRTVDELVRIRGIGRKQVRALRPHLAVSGPTTATARRSDRRSDAAVLAELARAEAAGPPPKRPPPKPPPPPARPVSRAPGRGSALDFPLASRRYCLRPP